MIQKMQLLKILSIQMILLCQANLIQNVSILLKLHLKRKFMKTSKT